MSTPLITSQTSDDATTLGTSTSTTTTTTEPIHFDMLETEPITNESNVFGGRTGRQLDVIEMSSVAQTSK